MGIRTPVAVTVCENLLFAPAPWACCTGSLRRSGWCANSPRKRRKQFGTAPVELRERNNHGTAKRPAWILKPVRRLDDAVLVVEPFVSVELFVPPEIIRAAMKLAGSVLNGDVHLPTCPRAVFRGVIAHQHLHFAYGVDAGCEPWAGALGGEPKVGVPSSVTRNWPEHR